MNNDLNSGKKEKHSTKRDKEGVFIQLHLDLVADQRGGGKISHTLLRLINELANNISDPQGAQVDALFDAYLNDKKEGYVYLDLMLITLIDNFYGNLQNFEKDIEDDLSNKSNEDLSILYKQKLINGAFPDEIAPILDAMRIRLPEDMTQKAILVRLLLSKLQAAIYQRFQYLYRQENFTKSTPLKIEYSKLSKIYHQVTHIIERIH